MLRSPASSARLSEDGMGNTRHHKRVCVHIIYAPNPVDIQYLSFVDILKSKPGPQMSYQVSFCFWLLSFDQLIAEQIDK